MGKDKDKKGVLKLSVILLTCIVSLITIVLIFSLFSAMQK